MFKASAGVGRWASVPWFAIFDKSITTSATQGVYLVFLFSNDYKNVYLSLNQGWTYFNNMGKVGQDRIKKVSAYWKDNLNLLYDRKDFTHEDIKIEVKEETMSNLPKGYELGNIYSKHYDRSSLMDNEMLLADLVTIKGVYSELKTFLIKGNYIKTVEAILKNDIYHDLISNSRKIDSDIETVVVDSEGRKQLVYGYKYERKPHLRKQALEIHGYNCSVCNFNFREVYGDLGKEFIEVHHIMPLFIAGGEVEINPATDLLPVCSNCHRMIHRRKKRL